MKNMLATTVALQLLWLLLIELQALFHVAIHFYSGSHIFKFNSPTQSLESVTFDPNLPEKQIKKDGVTVKPRLTTIFAFI